MIFLILLKVILMLDLLNGNPFYSKADSIDQEKTNLQDVNPINITQHPQIQINHNDKNNLTDFVKKLDLNYFEKQMRFKRAFEMENWSNRPEGEARKDVTVEKKESTQNSPPSRSPAIPPPTMAPPVPPPQTSPTSPPSVPSDSSVPPPTNSPPTPPISPPTPPISPPTPPTSPSPPSIHSPPSRPTISDCIQYPRKQNGVKGSKVKENNGRSGNEIENTQNKKGHQNAKDERDNDDLRTKSDERNLKDEGGNGTENSKKKPDNNGSNSANDTRPGDSKIKPDNGNGEDKHEMKNSQVTSENENSKHEDGKGEKGVESANNDGGNNTEDPNGNIQKNNVENEDEIIKGDDSNHQNTRKNDKSDATGADPLVGNKTKRSAIYSIKSLLNTLKDMEQENTKSGSETAFSDPSRIKQSDTESKSDDGTEYNKTGITKEQDNTDTFDYPNSDFDRSKKLSEGLFSKDNNVTSMQPSEDKSSANKTEYTSKDDNNSNITNSEANNKNINLEDNIVNNTRSLEGSSTPNGDEETTAQFNSSLNKTLSAEEKENNSTDTNAESNMENHTVNKTQSLPEKSVSNDNVKTPGQLENNKSNLNKTLPTQEYTNNSTIIESKSNSEDHMINTEKLSENSFSNQNNSNNNIEFNDNKSTLNKTLNSNNSNFSSGSINKDKDFETQLLSKTSELHENSTTEGRTVTIEEKDNNFNINTTLNKSNSSSNTSNIMDFYNERKENNHNEILNTNNITMSPDFFNFSNPSTIFNKKFSIHFTFKKNTKHSEHSDFDLQRKQGHIMENVQIDPAINVNINIEYRNDSDNGDDDDNDSDDNDDDDTLDNHDESHYFIPHEISFENQNTDFDDNIKKESNLDVINTNFEMFLRMFPHYDIETLRDMFIEILNDINNGHLDNFYELNPKQKQIEIQSILRIINAFNRKLHNY